MATAMLSRGPAHGQGDGRADAGTGRGKTARGPPATSWRRVPWRLTVGDGHSGEGGPAQGHHGRRVITARTAEASRMLGRTPRRGRATRRRAPRRGRFHLVGEDGVRTRRPTAHHDAGTAASSPIRVASGPAIQRGASSDRKIAVPSQSHHQHHGDPVVMSVPTTRIPAPYWSAAGSTCPTRRTEATVLKRQRGIAGDGDQQAEDHGAEQPARSSAVRRRRRLRSAIACEGVPPHRRNAPLRRTPTPRRGRRGGLVDQLPTSSKSRRSAGEERRAGRALELEDGGVRQGGHVGGRAHSRARRRPLAVVTTQSKSLPRAIRSPCRTASGRPGSS